MNAGFCGGRKTGEKPLKQGRESTTKLNTFISYFSFLSSTWFNMMHSAIINQQTQSSLWHTFFLFALFL
jgi:hypothetical protein